MQQFKGFKPEAMQRIAGTLGYQGDMSGFKDYLNQNPDKMQQMGMYQQKALQMVNGGMVRNFANGGDVDYSQYYDDKGVLTNKDGSPAQQLQPIPDIQQDGAFAGVDKNDPRNVNVFAPDQLTQKQQPAQQLQPIQQQKQQPATGLLDPRVLQPQQRVDTLAGAADKVDYKDYYDTSGQLRNMEDDSLVTPQASGIREGMPTGMPKGFTGPSDDAMVTQAFVDYYNPTTKQIWSSRTGGYTPPEGWIQGKPDNPEDYDYWIDPTPIYPIEPLPEPDFPIYPDPIDPDPIEAPTKPEPLPEPDFSTGYAVPDYAEGQLKDLATGKEATDDEERIPFTDLSTATLEGSIVKFDNGKEIQARDEGDAKYIFDAAISYGTNIQKPFLEKANTYRTWLGKQTSEGVTKDIKNVGEEYQKATNGVSQKKIELRRLQKLAEANPDDTYYAELVETKVEELADDMDRVTDLQETYTATQKTVKDLTKERYTAEVGDPDFAISEAKGTKVMADKIAVQPDQFIKEGTGQLDSVAQGVTSDAKSFDADAPDVADASTYDGEKVTDTAEDKLKNLEAQTQDDLTREVEGQTDTIRGEGKAKDDIKIAADRIERAVNPIDLEVTKLQLAEVKGKLLEDIKADFSISARLKDIIAQTGTVDLKELPPPAKISDNIMRSVQALKETDPSLSGETTSYIAAKMEAFTVSSGTLAVAMQGDVSAQATVQGQLSSLMKSFDNGTPAWAAGAIRAANEAMLSRGMAASSMAAVAIVQAAMESALPIAQQDAQIYAAMGMANLDNLQKVSLANAAAQQGLSLQNLSNEQQMNLQNSVQAFDLQKQNLSNRQSVELANAQIRSMLQGKVLDNTQQSNIITAARYAEQANINLSNKQQGVLQDNVGSLQTNLADANAKQQSYITSANLAASLQGQVLTNDQQVSISNAARYSDAANLNFTSDQQEVLHNSSLMQSIGLAELSTTQAATLQNAANFATMDMAELSNAQQAQVLNAQNFLQLDLANLSNEQQVALFKAQAVQQTLLSDQASINASEQFNATSENQVEQFNANLKTQVDQFNKAQQTAISQFNAGEDNAMEKFNVSQANAADQFNAQNELVIAQSNATWRREVATADTASQNRANEINAKNTLDIQDQAYDNMWNHYGDQMDKAYTSAENEAGRASDYAIAQLDADAKANEAAALRDAGASKSLGELAATLLTGNLSKGILKGIF